MGSKGAKRLESGKKAILSLACLPISPPRLSFTRVGGRDFRCLAVGGNSGSGLWGEAELVCVTFQYSFSRHGTHRIQRSLQFRVRAAKNQRALSMAQQTRSGHVYIISNVGSFGDDVLKTGMTVASRQAPLDAGGVCACSGEDAGARPVLGESGDRLSPKLSIAVGEIEPRHIPQVPR